MKQILALILAALMAVSFAACGSAGESEENQVITRSAAQETQPLTPADAENATPDPFTFTYEDVTLIPGQRFDPDALPEADSVYQVPSCAFEGTDNVYNYGIFEVTAYHDGAGELVYSIYFLDPNLTTPEGLAFGSTAETVTELYGEAYTEEGTAWVYTRGGSQLCLIFQDGAVASIEYLMCE